MTSTAHTLRVTLLNTRPAVMWLVQVPSETTFEDLSDELEEAMEWEDDSHLHTFYVRGVSFGPSEYVETNEWQDEAEFSVGEMLQRPGAKMVWRYDLGDCWDHEIVVESIDPADGTAPETDENDPSSDDATRRWLPQGEKLKIAGRDINGGTFYVGSGNSRNGPNFVDPDLPVRWSPSRWVDPHACNWVQPAWQWDRGDDPTQHSYQECSPVERGLFLEWLASYLSRVEQPYPRHHNWAGSPPHCWSWYLQGIEHRLLVDAAESWTDPETQTLISRLTSNDSRIDNQTYFSHIEAKRFQLVNFVCGMMHQNGAHVDDELRSGLPNVPYGYPLLIDLGNVVANQQPIPADLALEYIHLDNKISKTRITYSLPEYEELFRRLYNQRHGAGLVIAAEDLPELVLEYQPVSASLPAQRHPQGVPDLRRCGELQEPLRDIVACAVDTLRPFAKAVSHRQNRLGNRRRVRRGMARSADIHDAAVISHLPEPLFDTNPITAKLRAWAQDIANNAKTTQMPLGELSQRCHLVENVPTPGEKAGIAETLKRLGMGCDPDIRTISATAKPELSLTLHTLER